MSTPPRPAGRAGLARVGIRTIPGVALRARRVIVAIVCVVILINFLLGIVGQPIVKLR